MSASGLAAYRKVGLEPRRLESVPIERLLVEISLDYESISTPFYRNAQGQTDHSILGSPLFRLLQSYESLGRTELFRCLKDQDYYRFFMSVNQIGAKTNLLKPSEKIPVHYDDAVIRGKVERFIRVHESIKKEGYLQGKFAGHYIGVVEAPFVTTRFGWKVETAIQGFEIFSGHHRAASLACLGQSPVQVVVLEDVWGQSREPAALSD